MKKKRLLANILTLVFAISVMSFGIYAAYSANLTMTGTVGFIAHECEVEVLGTITNAIRSKELNFAKVKDQKHTVGSDTWYDKFSELDDQENPTDTPVAIANENAEWVFGDIYFDDIYTEADGEIQDVIITLQVTNKSVYPVEMLIDTTNVDIPEGVTFDAPASTIIAVNETKDILMVASLTGNQTQSTTALNLANCVVEFNKNVDSLIVPEGAVSQDSGWEVTAEGAVTAFPLLEQNNNSKTITVPRFAEVLYSNGNYVEVKSIGYGSIMPANAYLYENIIISDTVETISMNAFSGCYLLKELTIPSSVNTIKQFAFSNCDVLQTVNLASSADISATSSQHPFYNCKSLTTVNIDSNLTKIGDDFFNSVTSLTTINIPDDSILETIGSSAFSGCTGLTEISFPDTLININDSAFTYCTGLTEISFPNSLTTIGNYAFRKCSNLESVTILKSITSMGTSVFESCTSLKTVNWASSGRCGTNMFKDCPAFTTVNIDSELTIVKGCFSGVTSLTTVNFGENVQIISGSAFRNCTGISELNFPNSLKIIESSAFAGCTGLKEVNISNSLEELYTSAFSGCTELTEITIPSSVKTIGSSVFSDCTKLTKIYIESSIIANGLTSIGAKGYLLSNAETVYIKNLEDGSQMNTSSSTYLTANFETSTDESIQETGYTCWVRKATT